MPDSHFRLPRVVQNWLQVPIILYNEFRSTQKRYDGAFAYSSISDDDNGLGILIVNGYGLNTIVDEFFQFGQVDRIDFSVHKIKV